MDFVQHFRREVVAFEAAARRVADEPPPVATCPGWSVSDLVVHLGSVHRGVGAVVREGLTRPPGPSDIGTPAEHDGWPSPERAPNHAPMPASLLDWFHTGAAELAALFQDRDPRQQVWTWSREQTVEFWTRMQTIEAAIHRWDAENAAGDPAPVDAELAADAVGQTVEVMVPFRRTIKQARQGAGERYRFRRTDGIGVWTVRFDGDTAAAADAAEPCDVELAGSASDLTLFLWQRVPADRLDVTGDRALLERYFTLVPPV